MSPYQLKNLREPGVKEGTFKQLKLESKLYPSLFDLNNHVVGHDLLAFMIQLGYQIKRVNEVLEFQTDPYIRPYVVGNQNLRMKTKDPVLKQMYKDANNTVYERFGMRVENHDLKTVVYNTIKSISVVGILCNELDEVNPHYDSSLDNQEQGQHKENDQSQNQNHEIDMETDIDNLVNNEFSLLDELAADVIVGDIDSDLLNSEKRNNISEKERPKLAKDYENPQDVINSLLKRSNNLQFKVFNSTIDGKEPSVCAIVGGIKPDKKKVFKNLRPNAPTILDNAKISISKFCYDINLKLKEYLPQKYEDVLVALSGTDTDSAFLHISAYVKEVKDKKDLISDIYSVLHEKIPAIDFGNCEGSERLGQFYTNEKNKKFFRYQIESPKKVVLESIMSAVKEYMNAFFPEDKLFVRDPKVLKKCLKLVKKHKGLSHRFNVHRQNYINRIPSIKENIPDRDSVKVAGFRNEKG